MEGWRLNWAAQSVAAVFADEGDAPYVPPPGLSSIASASGSAGGVLADKDIMDNMNVIRLMRAYRTCVSSPSPPAPRPPPRAPGGRPRPGVRPLQGGEEEGDGTSSHTRQQQGGGVGQGWRTWTSLEPAA